MVRAVEVASRTRLRKWEKMSQPARALLPPRRAFGVRLALLLTFTLVASLIVTPGAAMAATTSPTFSRTDYQQLGNNHVVADFNGDARPDLAGIGAQSVAVLLGNGNGTFGARVEYPVATWAQDLAAGDFNRDGKLDLAVTINDLQVGLSLLAGNGDGTFRAAVNFANTSGFDSPAVVATDLNNDGKLDVVMAHQIACYTAPCRVARTISVLTGNGDGTFQPTRGSAWVAACNRWACRSGTLEVGTTRHLRSKPAPCPTLLSVRQSGSTRSCESQHQARRPARRRRPSSPSVVCSSLTSCSSWGARAVVLDSS